FGNCALPALLVRQVATVNQKPYHIGSSQKFKPVRTRRAHQLLRPLARQVGQRKVNYTPIRRAPKTEMQEARLAVIRHLCMDGHLFWRVTIIPATSTPCDAFKCHEAAAVGKGPTVEHGVCDQ